MGSSCCCYASTHSRTDQHSSSKPDVNEEFPLSVAPVATNKPTIVVGVYSYKARDSQDLSFEKGDRMEVLDESDGWLIVEHLISGMKGYIPGNYVALELSVESEDWFFKNISRKDAEKRLLGDESHSRGTFLIRPSEHDPNGYSLSVKDCEGNRGYHVKHYKIKSLDNGGFYIASNLRFVSLPELVMTYSKNAHGLCHVLSEPCRKHKPNTDSLAPNKWEIPRDEIKLLTKLGSGNFGEVFYGKWKNQYEVAVKTLREGTMSTQAFLEEAAIMKKFKHTRLVQLYGICSDREPLYIVQEYMKKGNLLDYLKADKGATLKFDDLCYIAFQVASGMEYMEELNFIHRDLAARNVLIGNDNVTKICDFGMARVIQDDEYIAALGGKFPIKWTAPEAIMEGRFTVKSDVWSFGIFLMELYTYGETPYQGMISRVVVDMVLGGHRMGKPKNHPLPDEIYQVMLKCWDKEPETRPTFRFLAKYFETMDVSLMERSFKKEENIVIQHNKPNTYEEHMLQG